MAEDTGRERGGIAPGFGLSMELSPHFTLSEFTRSQTATRRGIANVPDAAVIANLRLLCVSTLEPIRNLFGQPLAVTSGFRSPSLNKAIGGAKTSQHCLGQAADFFVPGLELRTIYERIRRSDIVFDQLILEGSWIHVSYREHERRQQCLLAYFEGQRVSYVFDP